MLAIIGGSGLYSLGQDFILDDQIGSTTPYGDTSSPILLGRWQDSPVVFLTRHGASHKVPPHRINYRANLWSLKRLGVTEIIAVNAVGGISDALPPPALALPDQIIDYSSGREQTFFEGGEDRLEHVDFTWPYSAELRERLLRAGRELEISIVATGTYGNTSGPRLETAAEILRLQRDGCTMVGMTGMPEAVLARELGIDYACVALVVNWAAGIRDQIVSMAEIKMNLERGIQPIKSLLTTVVAQV